MLEHILPAGLLPSAVAPVALAVLLVLGCVLAACGVRASGAAAKGAADSTASPAAPRKPAHATPYDADVIIVGAGTAGASLAAVLARDGKRVVVVERFMGDVDRIVGELMQPGGIRCLERLGLSSCVKDPSVEAVEVEGYACVIPGEGEDCASKNCNDVEGAQLAARDVLLTYPSADPTSLREQLGWLGLGSASTPAKADNVCPVTGADLAPRGRSFHNHRFVHLLRRAALAEPNVTLYLGSARRLVHAGEARSAGAAHSARRTSVAPPAPFAGFSASGAVLPQPSGAPPAAPSIAVSAVPLPDGCVADDTVVGVAWHDAAGEHVTTAPLTVICDGMYSVLRPKLSGVVPRTVSYFCGLLLEHEVGAPPVPHPRRGHVVMTDPSPVLLYQISPTETRLLADVPASLVDEGGEGGASAAVCSYIERAVVPQLPRVSRAAVLAALAAQEPVVMPCKFLPAAPSSRAGAVLLGDSWNMRHPLTGGGMTVALRDVETLRCALAGVTDLSALPSGGLQARLGNFARRRAAHASTINILANALHRVFSRPAADDGTRARLRAACIEYLSLGGPFSAGPVGLLSGLTPRPAVLILHFIAVAMHATARALLPLPTPARLRRGYDLLHIACIILMPQIVAERVQGWSSPIVLAALDALFPWKGTVLEG